MSRGRRVDPTSRPLRSDGEATRKRILDAARATLRARGFAATTMRAIAERAETSPGLAYHYFDSKESIALALFEEHLERHAQRATERLASAETLRERLQVALETALETRAADREVLRALAGIVLDSEGPAWLFADGTAFLRDRSIGIFREVAACDDVGDDLREPLALALWAMHLGILLRFVHDATPDHAPTRALVDAALDLVPPLVSVLGTPFAAPIRERLLRAIAESGVGAFARGQADEPRA